LWLYAKCVSQSKKKGLKVIIGQGKVLVFDAMQLLPCMRESAASTMPLLIC
jgi:hypothetical protein